MSLLVGEGEHDAAVHVQIVRVTPRLAAVDDGDEGLGLVLGGHAGRHGRTAKNEIDLLLLGQFYQLRQRDGDHLERDGRIVQLAGRFGQVVREHVVVHVVDDLVALAGINPHAVLGLVKAED